MQIMMLGGGSAKGTFVTSLLVFGYYRVWGWGSCSRVGTGDIPDVLPVAELTCPEQAACLVLFGSLRIHLGVLCALGGE